MIQTTSKKVLRSSEKQKPRAYRTYPTSEMKVLCGAAVCLINSLNIPIKNT
mgnify:CR=1 FL=1